MLACHGLAGGMDTRADDCMYDCLPMYHAPPAAARDRGRAGQGGSVVLREVLRARVLGRHRALGLYAGAIYRRVPPLPVNSPPHPKERSHRLRLLCGNGLRPDIWREFKERFRIPEIIEFYAATEGNVTMFNFEGKEGAVGRIPWFLSDRFPTKVVRFDVERQQPIRDEQGFCIECEPGEAGEVIGKILKDSSKPGQRFEGYATETETEKKVLHNVFVKGDVWFRTGDLMRKDEDGSFLRRFASATRSAGKAKTYRPEVEEAIGGSTAYSANARCRWRDAAPVWRPSRPSRALI
jgi:fatty-acyl-CoA synthase